MNIDDLYSSSSSTIIINTYAHINIDLHICKHACRERERTQKPMVLWRRAQLKNSCFCYFSWPFISKANYSRHMYILKL